MGVSTYDAPWLHTEETQKLVKLFARNGIEMCFVGGAVRDALLGREPFDIDMITSATAEQVLAALATVGIHGQLRDPAFGLVVMFLGNVRYDITSLHDADKDQPFLKRVELYLGRAYDFTLNAVFLTPQGELHDHFGGLADAAAGKVVFLHDVETSITFDPYRMLRYFRAVAVFGAGEVDAAVLVVCVKHRESLQRVVRWKRCQETIKIAMSPKGVKMLRLMAREGLLVQALEFGLSDIEPLQRLQAIEGFLRIKPDMETRMVLFSILATVSGEEALAKLAEPYGWSAEMMAYYGWIVEQLEEGTPIDPSWRKTMGDKGFKRLVMAAWALEDDVMSAAEYYGPMIA